MVQKAQKGQKMTRREAKHLFRNIEESNADPEKGPDGRYIFSGISDKCREPEDSIIVTARCLSERRQKGGNAWKRKRR